MRERSLTYGEELRTMPKEKLSNGELRQLAMEEVWEQSNPDEVALLDSFIGKRVALVPKKERKPYATWAEELPPSERRVPGMANALIPTHLRAGLTFRVEARLGERLLGVDAVGDAWLLRREWLNEVHRVEKKHDASQAAVNRSLEGHAHASARQGGSGGPVAGLEDGAGLVGDFGFIPAAYVERRPRPML